MRIGILGTGTMAATLGRSWVRAGHELAVAGRSVARAEAVTARPGPRSRAVAPHDLAEASDALLVALLWEGVDPLVRAVGGPQGALAGLPLIDCTNAVEHGVGTLLPSPGESAAEHVAALAPGAHVVKALHLFPAEHWVGPPANGDEPSVVPICGDDPGALETVSALVRELGGEPVVVGRLTRARQLEEAAGLVIGLAFAGANPVAAVPGVHARPA
jgi:8-hydroxy-5-deazaflavin:NADPH oxidoreductase